MTAGRAETIESPARRVRAAEERMVMRVVAWTKANVRMHNERVAEKLDAFLRDVDLSILAGTPAKAVTLIEMEAAEACCYRDAQPLGCA